MLTSVFILPAVALLCNAEPIMTAVGLPPVNAAAACACTVRSLARLLYSSNPYSDTLFRVRDDPDRLTMGTRCLALVLGIVRGYPARNPT